MNKSAPLKTFLISFALVTLLSVVALSLPYRQVMAQEEEPTPASEIKDCGKCHLDIANEWSHSPHAHAFDDPYFQERWEGMGMPGDCLACHTTNYQASTGEYAAEGVYCESCHGVATENHPPEIIPIKADTEYCGSCHTTTLSEWRKTGHAAVDVGCMDCHDPHSQQNLFEDPDEMCINCHQEKVMGDYLNDLHVQKDIGCVDCHALVIPPDPIPDDGIVPTGHAFDITPGTCVACHTDALHAGFSLPGYENGAKASTGVEGETEEIVAQSEEEAEVETNPEQRLQALETALASRNMTNLFQGGVVGIVFGGTTAWIVARNVRRLPTKTEEEVEDDKEAEE